MFQKLKKLKLFRISQDSSESEPYEIDIYAIPLNKKGFCNASTIIETKQGEIKEIGKCEHWKDKAYCSECIKLAKQLYRMNH